MLIDFDRYKHFPIHDSRLEIAYKLVNSCNIGDLLKICKTTRAGATTSLLVALLMLNQPFLVLEPTNKIIKETIIKNVAKHSKKNVQIIHVPSNKECIRNKLKIENNKALEALPYLFLPTDCGKDCKYYNECPVTQILRVERFDGIAMTYDKLLALKISSELYGNKTSIEILSKIENAIKFILLDEAHELMYDTISSLEKRNTHNRAFAENLYRKFKKINDMNYNPDFQILRLLILNYALLINEPDIKKIDDELLQMLRDDKRPTFQKHQSASIKNPRSRTVFHCAIKPKNEDDLISGDFCKNGFFIGELTENRCQEAYFNIYNQIIQLADYTKKFDITVEDLTALCDMLNLEIEENLSVHCQQKRKIKMIGDKRLEFWEEHTDLCAVDKNKIRMLQQFITTIQDKTSILVTSATFCSYDYSQLSHPEKTVREVLFGINGDPLNTNSKLTIFADTYTFSATGEYSVYNRREEIKQRCQDVMDIYGDDDCLIICANKEDSKLIKNLFEDTEYNPEITYYRASEVMGVESSKRVCILIGLAHKPGHAFDVMRGTANESQILKEESMHADVMQAASRVKDPAGLEPSIVFALGCREYDLNNVFKWGIGRDVHITQSGGKTVRKDIDVTISGDEIPQPNIKYLHDWQETLVESILCKESLYSYAKKLPLLSNVYGTFQAYQYKINSKSNLFDSFFGHQNVDTSIRNSDGSFTKPELITDELVSKHLSEKIELHFNSLQPDNSVNFVMFESFNEQDIHRLKIHLDSMEIPYVIEKLVPYVNISIRPDPLRVWILLEPVPASLANQFAKNLLKQAGFKVRGDKEIDFYPKKTKRNPRNKGARIRMPFGKGSKILVDGEFVDDFEELNFGNLILT
ncbi:hypothetical protein MettiDRAFT_2352 [Methanolobus tindarius DSM 2278]|uniref:TOTE conflict system primase domain-containing protein n=1 Tax=Methanolobus tindarius DSM 2278 TaxID=1090322 RepID=W9DTA2_METTI|nr:hypothetical protein [Methanolobus tindarius]ETA68865.1 hypothetical protein MettiDRAFT_2352 [Methanolobus tindarius DSM 2278]